MIKDQNTSGFVPHSVYIDSCLLATSMYKFTGVKDGVRERWRICIECGLMEGKKWLEVGCKGAHPIFQNLVLKHFHLKDQHSEEVYSKFELKRSSCLDVRSSFVICSCLYLTLLA